MAHVSHLSYTLLLACTYVGLGQTNNFLFVGNPGTGKSTLINGVVGTPIFKARTSVSGSGITYQFDKKDIPGVGVFMDTPGLSDEKLRVKAANAITTALKQEGFYRIFFVLTTEAGRVRAEDKATMKLILDAAPTITDYNIIINKVTKKWWQKMQDPQNQQDLRSFHALLMEGLPKTTSSIHFMYKMEELEDEDDVQYEAPKDVVQFIRNAPGMVIRSVDVNDVKPDQFTQLRQEHEKALEALRADSEAMKKAMETQMERIRADSERRENNIMEAQRRERMEYEAKEKQLREDRAAELREYRRLAVEKAKGGSDDVGAGVLLGSIALGISALPYVAALLR